MPEKTNRLYKYAVFRYSVKMRTLIFTGGNRPDIDILKHYIQKYNTVIAADSGLHTADELGIYPDYIVGDMDSLTDNTLTEKYAAAELRRFPCEKDFTDTDLAVKIAEENNADEIIFAGAGGGRVDHLLYFFKTFGSAKASLIWVHDTGIAFCIDAERTTRFILPDIKGAYISIAAAGTAPHKIKSKGLFWPLDHLDWTECSISLSNNQSTRLPDMPQPIELEPESGRFIVLLSPLDTYDFQIIKRV